MDYISQAVSFNNEDPGKDVSSFSRTYTFNGPIPVAHFDPETNQWVHYYVNPVRFTNLNEFPGYESKIQTIMKEISFNNPQKNYALLAQLEEETGHEFLTQISNFGGYRKGAIISEALDQIFKNDAPKGLQGVTFQLKQHTNVLHIGVPDIKRGEAYLTTDKLGRTVFGLNIVDALEQALDNDGDRGQLLELIASREGNQVGRYLLGSGKYPHYRTTNNFLKIVEYNPAKALEKLAPVQTTAIVEHLTGKSKTGNKRLGFYGVSQNEAIERIFGVGEYEKAIRQAGQKDFIGLIVDSMKAKDAYKYQAWLREQSAKNTEFQKMINTPGSEFMLKMMYTKETGGSLHTIGFMTQWDILGMKGLLGRKGRIDFKEYESSDEFKSLNQLAKASLTGVAEQDANILVAQRILNYHTQFRDEVLTSKIQFKDNVARASFNRKKLEQLSRPEQEEVLNRISLLAKRIGLSKDEAAEYYFRSWDTNARELFDVFATEGDTVLKKISNKVKSSPVLYNLNTGRKLVKMMQTSTFGETSSFGFVQITPLVHAPGTMPDELDGKVAAHIQFRKWVVDSSSKNGGGYWDSAQLMGGLDKQYKLALQNARERGDMVEVNRLLSNPIGTGGYALPGLYQNEDGSFFGASGSQAFGLEASRIFKEDDLKIKLKVNKEDRYYSMFGEAKMFDKGEAFSTEVLTRNTLLLKDISEKLNIPQATIVVASHKNDDQIRDIVNKYLSVKYHGKILTKLRLHSGEYAIIEDIGKASYQTGAASEFLANALNIKFNQSITGIEDKELSSIVALFRKFGLSPTAKGLFSVSGGDLNGNPLTNNSLLGFRSFAQKMIIGRDNNGNPVFNKGFEALKAAVSETDGGKVALDRFMKAFRQNSGGIQTGPMDLLVAGFDPDQMMKTLAQGVIEQQDLKLGEGSGILTTKGETKLRERLRLRGKDLSRFGKIQTDSGGIKFVPQTAEANLRYNFGQNAVDVDLVVNFDEFLRHDKGGGIIGQYLTQQARRAKIINENQELSDLTSQQLEDLINQNKTHDGHLILRDFDMLRAPLNSSEMTESESSIIFEDGFTHNIEKTIQSDAEEAPYEIFDTLSRAVTHISRDIGQEFTLSDETIAHRAAIAHHELGQEIRKSGRFDNRVQPIQAENIDLHDAISARAAAEILSQNQSMKNAETARKLGRMAGTFELMESFFTKHK